jgi:hypothetical protein
MSGVSVRWVTVIENVIADFLPRPVTVIPLASGRTADLLVEQRDSRFRGNDGIGESDSNFRSFEPEHVVVR